MGRYLLRLVEGHGEFENYTYHLIEAEDEQMVKYHYHRTLKNWGYRPADWGGKHALDGREMGAAEIDRIFSLSPAEYEVMDNYVTEWYKV